MESHGPTVIHDLRGRSEHTFEKTGFEVLRLDDSQMLKEDFYDEAKVKMVYYEESKVALTKRFSGQGMKRVEVLEHLVILPESSQPLKKNLRQRVRANILTKFTGSKAPSKFPRIDGD